MINTQLKSHWRLAYRTTKKAFILTFKLIGENIKANLYFLKSDGRLHRQRIALDYLEQEINSRLSMRFARNAAKAKRAEAH